MGKKKHLISFYEQDNKYNLRVAPKLTHSHIYPRPFKKIKVFLTSQAFGLSVLDMKTYLTYYKYSTSSKATIEFIDDIKKLFDIYNSSRKLTS